MTDHLIKQILKEIKLKENGPASEAMSRMGLKYKQNYGVAVPEMRQIALKYKGNSKLSEELLKIESRETKILGILVADPETISEKQINAILDGINNIELAEQSCINLFEKIPACRNKAVKWIAQENQWIKVTGYLIFSRIAQKNDDLENDFFRKLIDFAPNDFMHESLHVRKALARALRNTALRNKTLKELVFKIVEPIKDKGNSAAAIIYEETIQLL